jgi:biofilm PGA synthesis N-glycosyltransferase PgaC
LHLTTKAKFIVALLVSLSWMGFSFWYSQPWYSDLSNEIGLFPAYFLITFIAMIPGFMNAFVFMALIFDVRPLDLDDQRYPPVTVLIAAYNEATAITSTLASLFKQSYSAPIRIILISDGSYDLTVE